MQYPNYDGMGVYALVDENGKMYIGSSVNCKKRFHEHDVNFVKGRETQIMQNAYNQGIVFHGEILEKISYGNNLYFLRKHEEDCIKQYDSVINGYNSRWITATTKEQDENLLQMVTQWGAEEQIAQIQQRIDRMSTPITKKLTFRKVIINLDSYTFSAIKAHAEQNGETLNSFINRAIDQTIERDRQNKE